MITHTWHLPCTWHLALTAASAQGAAVPPWETGMAVSLTGEQRQSQDSVVGSLVTPGQRPGVGPQSRVDCFCQRHRGGLLGGARPSQEALQTVKCSASLQPFMASRRWVWIPGEQEGATHRPFSNTGVPEARRSRGPAASLTLTAGRARRTPVPSLMKR